MSPEAEKLVPHIIERVTKLQDWIPIGAFNRVGWVVAHGDPTTMVLDDQLTNDGLRVLEDALLKAGAAHDYAKGQYFWWLWKSRFAGSIGAQLGADESREVAAMLAYLAQFEDTAR